MVNIEHRETWNEICFFMEKSKNATERDFETTVLFLFEKLGWSQFRGEIVSQVSIPIGSSGSVVPDIIIKNEGQNVFVIELKKPNTKLNDKHTNQLVSYMRLLKLNCGILIGETLKIYYEVPSDNKPPIQIEEIPFMMDTDAGVRFAEVFRKDINTSDNITKYCENRLAALQEEEKVKQYLDLLCSPDGSKLFRELLHKKLSTELSEEAILSIIDKIFINVSRKESKPQEKETQQILISNKEEIINSVFQDVLNYFENKNKYLFDKRRVGNNFRLICIDNWPWSLHYEFYQYRKKGIGVEFHIEDKNYNELSKFLKEYHNQRINKYPIEYDPNWHKLGRIRIVIPYKDGKEIIAQTMLDFIALTKEPIEDFLKNNKIGKYQGSK